MRHLDLNLASRPFRNNTLLWSGFAVALALLAGASIGSAYVFHRDGVLLERLRDTTDSLVSQQQDLESREREARAGISAFDLDFLRTQAVKANEVIEWKAFSWTRLFNHLERLQPQGVRMVSIRPLFRRASREVGGPIEPAAARQVQVALEGVARDFEAIWELQNVLLADAHFSRLDPQRLQRKENGEILFRVRFLYHPELEPPPEDAGAGAPARSPGDEAERKRRPTKDGIVRTAGIPLQAVEVSR